MIGVRVPPDFRARIEEWGRNQGEKALPLAVAIRRLLETHPALREAAKRGK